MPKLQLACVFLASGMSARFGANKLIADFKGQPLAQVVLNNHAAELFVQNIVVTKYPAVALAAAERGFTVCENHFESNDISHTIRLGLNAINKKVDGCMFSVCDIPFFTPESCAALVNAFYNNPEKIITAADRGESKNPCIFPKGMFKQLAALTDNQGGRYVINQNLNALIKIEVPPKELMDIDTQKDILNAISI